MYLFKWSLKLPIFRTMLVRKHFILITMNGESISYMYTYKASYYLLFGKLWNYFSYSLNPIVWYSVVLGETCIQLAALGSHFDIMRHLLIECRADINDAVSIKTNFTKQHKTTMSNSSNILSTYILQSFNINLFSLSPLGLEEWENITP